MGRRRGDRALTSAERLEIRRRVATGEPIGRVAAGVGRSSRLVHLVLRRAGGLPPRISPRSTLRLSEAEAGGDQPWPARRRVLPADRGETRPGALDGVA